MAKYKRAVIVGVGLLGGSIGLALRKRQLADEVIGVGRDNSTLEKAMAVGAIDQAACDVANACAGADLAIICTPVQSVGGYVQQCARSMAPGGLITDVGSTKRTIVDSIEATEHQCFCGAHPLAGSDRSGVDHASADLLDGRTTIVTPTEQTPKSTTLRTEQFWQELGSTTCRMTAAEHDDAVAWTSHLPHLAAAAIADATPESMLRWTATGWCDTTRVAGGSVELWTQILQENKSSVLGVLEHYITSLERWQNALANDDYSHIESLLTSGKRKRDSVGN